MKAAILVAAAAFFCGQAEAQVSGFVQLRAAHRVNSGAQCPPAGCETMVGETLAEMLFEHPLSAGSALTVRAEATGDGISRRGKLDLREATIAWQPAADIDFKFGRQIITWGVSDYLYVNDIFPKNYDAFFSGGSFDRIKEPVDAAHLTFHRSFDLELVVSKSKADRMPSPLRFTAVATAATAVPVEEAHESSADAAFKFSTKLDAWDFALYAATLKSRETRAFLDDTGLRSDRPRLRHLGISITGNAAAGVIWMEAALRHVDADRPNVVDRNFFGSSAKFILGYSREIAAEATASAQVQVESPWDRAQYVRSLAPGTRPVAAFNPLLHLRVVGHWANQTFGAGAQLFAGAEGDTHFNPFASWSPVDGWTLEAGANFFDGRRDTRFGALRHDSNVYAAARYSY